MAIRFKGDMTKVVAKNKGDMTKTTLRKRVSSIISQILGGGSSSSSSTPLLDTYTKMLLHFNDTATSSSSISAYYPMGGAASPDGTKVYVGSWGPASASQGVHVIDVATGTKTATISTPGTAIDLVVNSTGTRVYASNYGSASSNANGNSVYVIDAVNNSLLSSVTVGSASHSIAITPNDKFVYVACELGGLYVIDTTVATLSSTQVLTTSNAKYAVQVSSDGTKLLVSTGSTVYGYTINQTTGALTLSTTLTGFSSAWTSTKNSTYAYFMNNDAGTVTPVAWSTLTKATNITVGSGPYGAGVSPDGKKLYVANTGGNTVSVIDTTTNTVIGTLTGYTTPRKAISVGSKLFVSNNTASTISVTDQASFSDVALSPLTQYKFGTVSSSATQSKFGGKSLYLNGTNTNKLQFANPKGKAINFGTSNWTMEGWFYFNQKNIGYQPLIVSTNFNSAYPGPELYLENNSCLCIAWRLDSDYGARNYIWSSFNPDANRWYHIAVVRNGSTMTMYVDGTSVGSTSVSGSIYNPDYIGLGVFGHAQSVAHFNGYLDGIRIQVGEAVYTGNFTAPTTAPAANSYTKLLMNFDSTIKDESTGNLYTYAVGSTPQISTAQAKFGTSSLKMSGGTSDYIKIHNETQPIALLDKPFCIEGWFYLNANNVGYQPIIMTRTSGLYDGPIVYMESNNTLYAQLSAAGGYWDYPISTGFTPTANAWHHVALVRDYTSGPIKLYCDGVLRGTNSTTASVFTGENIFIGHYPNFADSNKTLNGYVDEVRIVVGKNPYSGEFTPASTAYTDGYNMLLHFDGANGSTTVTDSSTSLKTMTAYGGATISTTKSKFGGSSMYFPGVSGTGCRVKANNSSDFAFGTGDFTVEMNLNLSSLGTGHIGTMFGMVFDTRTSITQGPGLFMYFDSNRKLKVWAQGTTFATSNTTIEIGNWYHVALTRKSSKFYLYINGVLDATADLATNFTESSMSIGAPFDYSGAPGFLFNGYIDEFRVCKGTALYNGYNPAAQVPFTLIGESTRNTVSAFGRTFQMSSPGVSADGIATADVVSEGIKFYMPLSGGSMKNAFFAKDLTNTKTANQAKTIVASLKYPNSNFNSVSSGVGVGFKDVVSGRIFAMWNTSWAGNPTQWGYWNYTCDANGAPTVTTSPNTFVRAGNDVMATANTNFWIKLVDDGSTYITGYYSYDVTNPTWTQAFQVARTAWLTNGSGEIGVFGNTDSFGDGEFILTSYSAT